MRLLLSICLTYTAALCAGWNNPYPQKSVRQFASQMIAHAKTLQFEKLSGEQEETESPRLD